MLSLKLLFKPREFLKIIPENKVSGKLILFFFCLAIFSLILGLFLAGFSQTIKEYSEASLGLSPIEQIIIFIIATLTATFLLFLWCLIILFLTKLFLKLKGISINWKKIINIFFYSNILHYVLLIIFVVLFSIVTSLIKFTGEKIDENFANNLVYFLENYGRLFILLFFIIIYVYLMGLEIKNKKINNIL
ncbi:MAG TPA: hypothetical protein PKL13_01640 [bacterium]|nr:hypothetical protein [bacterium]